MLQGYHEWLLDTGCDPLACDNDGSSTFARAKYEKCTIMGSRPPQTQSFILGVRRRAEIIMPVTLAREVQDVL
jgi:hypothetical protein